MTPKRCLHCENEIINSKIFDLCWCLGIWADLYLFGQFCLFNFHRMTSEIQKWLICVVVWADLYLFRKFFGSTFNGPKF